MLFRSLDRVVDRLAQDYGHPMDEADAVQTFDETTVAGGMAPVQDRLEEVDDPINYNAAITGSYYEDSDPLTRIKTLALPR